MAQPVPYGKYTLLEKLASGSVADIFRAVTRKADGTNLVLVIKRIRPEVARNPEFAALFLDEARVASLLNHPNIARVYEWGREQDSFFIAMEYIEGTNLASLMQSLLEQGQRFPPTMAVHVAIEVLKGLAYAHDLKDAYGNPLKIVHRGINPPNIVISSDGKVKLVDFGLAKAAVRNAPTGPGTFAAMSSTYVAPEQLRRRSIDGRADLFSVGVVLYELLTSIKLRSDGDEAGIRAVVQAAQAKPPTAVFPDIPAELTRWIQQCMAEDPIQRPASAAALLQTLSDFLGRWDRQLDAAALSSFLVATLSGKAAGKPKGKGFAFGEATSQWMARGENLEELIKIHPELSADGASSAGPASAPAVAPAADDFLAEFGGQGAPAAAEPPVDAEPGRPEPEFVAPKGRFAAGSTVMAVEASGLGRGRQFKTLLLVLGVAAAVAVAVMLIVSSLSSKYEGQTPQVQPDAAVEDEKFAGEVELKVSPPEVLVFIDGDPYKPEGNPPKLQGVRAGNHRFKLVAPGYIPWEGEMQLQVNQPATIEQKLEERIGKVMLRSVPPGADILLNGKRVGKTPRTLEALPAGKTHQVILALKKYQPMKFNIEPTEWPEGPQVEIKIEKKLEKTGAPKKRHR